MARKLVGIGECMVELSQAEGGLMRKSFAGDVFNSLWYARAALPAAWSVGFLSAVGTDPTSDEMVSFIEAAGISCDPVRRLPQHRPGLYMIHLDGAERSFSYWRDTSAARQLAADPAHLDKVLGAADVVYLSGITLAILSDADLEHLHAALAKARAAGCFVAFDPNIRPALWRSPEHLRATIGKTASLASLVFPSFDDEQAAFGDPSPQASLERYRGYGADQVVVKNGAEDVLCHLAGETQLYPTPPVAAPVDTTGAGDSFNGAFLASYLQHSDGGQAVQAGQRCAAEVICHHGALITL